MGVPAIAGLALAAAGTGMQMAASSQERRRMNEATMAELNRQRGFQQQGAEQFRQSLAKSTPEAAARQRQAGQDTVTKMLSTLGQQPMAFQGSSQVSPQAAFVSDRPTQLTANTSNVNAARLGGYADWQLQQAIKDALAGQRLSVLGNFAQGSKNVLPIELSAAQQSAEGLRGAGQIVGMLGSGVGMYGGGLGYGAAMSPWSSYYNSLYNRNAGLQSNL